MDFATAIKTCFDKYATFSGRALRSEYWYFILFLVVGSLVISVIDGILFGGMTVQPLSAIFALATIVPSIAAAARRLHDVDKSGWWQLLGFIPIIGWIVLIVWLASRGTEGPNRYGDPA